MDGSPAGLQIPSAPVPTPGAIQREVQENFPVALRVLPTRLRRDLQSLYRFARYVDDLGDEFTGPREPALRAVADDLRRLYADDNARIPEVACLAWLRSARRVPIGPFLALVQANLQDQRVSRYETFADLLGYCALSANPVGRVVLYIVGAVSGDSAEGEAVGPGPAHSSALSGGARGGAHAASIPVPRRGRHRDAAVNETVDPAALMELSDRICTGLQLLEHWQDVGEDFAAGRVYLPQQDMRRFSVDEADLGRRRVSPALRDLLRFETDRASAYLNAGSPLVPTLPPWGRLAVSGYLAGGRAAAAQLRRCDFEVLAAQCKPASRQIAAAWLRAHLRSAG